MNFKRILVLVMALVMVVSAIAPSVLAAAETTHEHHDALDHLDTLGNLELVEKYEEIKALVEYVVSDVEENHDEYYAAGYAYALEGGYIDLAVEKIEEAIGALSDVDLSKAELTDELEAELQAELDSLVPALEKVADVLENGNVENVNGFANALVSLSGDIYANVNGAYAVLKQGKYDLDDDKLPAEFWSALSYVEDELLPVVGETASEFVNGVVSYVAENHEDYYAIGNELACVALDVYRPFVEVYVALDAYTAGAISEQLVDTADVLVMLVLDNVDSIDDALVIVTELYETVLDYVLDLVPVVEDALEYTDDVVLIATAVYGYANDLLVHVFGSTENALAVAQRLCDYVMHLVEEYGILQGAVENVEALNEKVSADVLEIIEACGGRKDSLVLVSKELAKYFVELVTDFAEYVEEKHNGAIGGNYELKDDSLYLALGNSAYGEELAAMLNLSDKYFQFGFDGDYLETLVKADLITVKLDDEEFYTFAEKQVKGIVAELVRNNDRVTFLREHALIGDYVNGVIADLGIDINAQAVELDWTKYINDEETLQMIEDAKEAVKAQLIANGAPEYYYIDLQPLVEEALEENGFGNLPGISVDVDPIEVPVADLAVCVVENVLYTYAKFTNNLNTLLNNLETYAPNATIVLVGVDNPIENMDIDLSEYGIDFITFNECKVAVGAFVEAFNAQLYVRGFIDNEVLFVYENDANAIYDAINVYCDHVYDDCEDVDCNRCLAVREAPGHSYGTYKYNNNATCEKDGTETAVCNGCGKKNTRTANKTALGHDWTKLTCTEDKKCTRCGTVGTKASGHKWGAWTVLDEPTLFSKGLREHTCRTCGFVEQEVMPALEPKYSAGTIIAVILSAIVFSGVVGGLIIKKAKKRNLLK